MPMVQGKMHRYKVLGAHLGLLCFLAVILFPFLMIISISLRQGNFAVGDIIPRQISFEHWKMALGIATIDAAGQRIEPTYPVLRWFWNSIRVSGISAFLILCLSTTAAYAFARLRFKGKTWLLNSILVVQMFPPVLSLVAIYTIFEAIGDIVPWLGIDSLGAVVLAYVAGIAVHVWTIKGYYDTVPHEIEEAAFVDGATPFQAFWYILLPMAVPIIAVVFVLAFIFGINEYPVASVLLNQQENLTLAVGSKQFLYPQHYLWGDFAAAAVLSGLPITIIFLLAQRWLVSGLTAGGVKG